MQLVVGGRLRPPHHPPATPRPPITGRHQDDNGATINIHRKNRWRLRHRFFRCWMTACRHPTGRDKRTLQKPQTKHGAQAGNWATARRGGEGGGKRAPAANGEERPRRPTTAAAHKGLRPCACAASQRWPRARLAAAPNRNQCAPSAHHMGCGHACARPANGGRAHGWPQPLT